MDLYPDFWTSSKVEGTTGGLFHEPSVSTASSVLPRFQPGLSSSKNLLAEIGAKDDVGGQMTPVLLPVLLPIAGYVSKIGRDG